VCICGFAILTGTFANTFAAFHYAFGRTIFPTVGVILEKGLLALFGFLLLKMGAGVEVMALVMLGGSLISMVWQAIWFFRLAGVKFILDPVLIRTMAWANIPFLISGVLLMGYTNIDTVMLSLMTNNATVGWYAAGTRIFDTLNFLPNIVISAIMYPIFAQLSTTSDMALKLALEKSINFLLFCAVPITTGLLVAAPNIVGFLYHRVEFLHSVLVMQLLAPGLIFIYINFALVSIIMSRRDDKKLPISSLVALVFNVVLNLCLIPLYQHLGAALSASLTEMLYCCVMITFVPRHLLPFGSLRVLFKAILASLVMALVMLPLRSFPIFVLVPGAALVYFAVALLLGTIPREDYRAVYNALGRKGRIPPSAESQSSQVPDLSPGLTQSGRTGELPLVASSDLAFETHVSTSAQAILEVPQSYRVDKQLEDDPEITLKLPRLRRQPVQQSLERLSHE
jgi:O-antigen/teichoic acid export membrane protein